MTKKATRPVKKATKQPKSSPPPARKNRIDLHAALAAALGLFLLVSILYYSGKPADKETIGIIGTWLVQGMEQIFGALAGIFPILLIIWGIQLFRERKYWSIRIFGVVILFLNLLVYYALYKLPYGMTFFEAAELGEGGGYLGALMAYGLRSLLGKMGANLAMALLLIGGVVMTINRPPKVLLQMIADALKNFIKEMDELLFYKEEEEQAPEPIIVNRPNPPQPQSQPQVAEPAPVLELPNFTMRTAEEPVRTPKPRKKANQPEYAPFPLELLSASETDRGFSKNDIKESIKTLEDTFANFGIKIKVNQVSCGPAVTRYELQPAPGVKVSKILSLTDDLQLSLAAKGIRIEAPIPGKSAVGIEVPNEKTSKVGLRSILSSQMFRDASHPLTVALGEDIAGNVVAANLAEMPHLLVAGSTGSGKSVCLNSLIISLLYKTTPEELKLVLIDPKMVELTVYNGVPHLMAPVVTDAKKAAYVLRWMINEMEKRYRRFAEEGVRDIYRYNESASDKLPFIVIIIDELADLMMVSPVDVEDSICRLAQMARASGMHLVVATQRPSVDVVTGLIKANIPSRIAFAVSSQADSRTILDGGGAEKLLGRGDMLFCPVGAAKPLRVQGTFVSDGEIEQVVEYIKAQSETTEAEEPKEWDISFDPNQEEVDDELFWEAVQVFVDTQKASVSLLQRKLKIGYARAARLVDIMEERGILSAADSNKRREILIDEAQLERLSSKALL